MAAYPDEAITADASAGLVREVGLRRLGMGAERMRFSGQPLLSSDGPERDFVGGTHSLRQTWSRVQQASPCSFNAEKEA